MDMDRLKHTIMDVLAVFAASLGVLATQLEQGGFDGIAWSSVVAAAIGGLIAWSRTSDGGLR